MSGASPVYSCPSDNELAELLDRPTSDERRAALETHIDRCPACASLMVELGRETDGPEPPTTPAGPRLGRYRVLDLLGRGGMGSVYQAFDPDLDRPVALKVLHAAADRAHHRLLREARAMAKLSHPNVVQVHEVGSFTGGWYIAMELIEGQTLGRWALGRTSRDRLRACLEAGRGLAAAHRAGLVHRDFKPSNVLCDDEGRARVTDFGLVASPGVTQRPWRETEPSPPSESWTTRTGAVLGTPGYMAPEQRLGAPADERSDQFSFCVTTWQILSGRHPGRRMPPTWPTDVPRIRRRLLDALRRGMRSRPDDRWPSMPALLSELERCLAPRRWPWLVVPAVALAAWGTFEGVQHHDRQQRIADCQAEGDAIQPVWNATKADEVSAAVASAKVEGAETIGARVLPWLDARAEQWQAQARNACTLTHVERTWDEDTYERAQWCLVQHRVAMKALVDDLVTTDPKASLKAVQAAATPTTVKQCTDPNALAAAGEVPRGQQRALAEEVRAQLERGKLHLLHGRVEPAQSLARSARRQADANSMAVLGIEAKLLEARSVREAGEFDKSRELTHEVYLDATRIQAWGLAADSASTMVFLEGRDVGRTEQARLWADLTDVAIGHAGDPLTLRATRRATSLALAEQHAGNYDAALELVEEAAAMTEASLGPDHPALATAVMRQGTVQQRRGELSEALELFERALALDKRALGPSHPMVGNGLVSLGTAQARLGRWAESESTLREAIAILDRSMGPDHVWTLSARATLGGMLVLRADGEGAVLVLAQVVEAYERMDTIEDRFAYASALLNLGSAHLSAQQYEQARTYFARARALPAVQIHTRNAGPARQQRGHRRTRAG